MGNGQHFVGEGLLRPSRAGPTHYPPPMPYTFRTTVHGHRVEMRLNDFGGQVVLVNGRQVSSKPFAAWSRPSHFLTLADETGRERAVELRLVPRRLGLSAELEVLVDGDARGTIEAVKPSARAGRCINCGHDLSGLQPANGEVRCPECGRHSAAPAAP